MRQTIAGPVLSALVLSVSVVAPALADTPVTLRARVEADSAAVTLGDVFDGAGEAASRPIAPAPAAGQVSTLSVAFLQTAAQSAGLSFTPPPGVSEVRVVHPAGARATVAAASAASNTESNASPSAAQSGAGVHRGDTVVVSYEIPGLSLNVRARASQDGAVGQTIRLVNLQSNQPIDAVVTGSGAARANP